MIERFAGASASLVERQKSTTKSQVERKRSSIRKSQANQLNLNNAQGGGEKASGVGSVNTSRTERHHLGGREYDIEEEKLDLD